MKKHLLFWILAVVMIAIFLAGCRKETFIETLPVPVQADGLYLKSATAGEMALVQYLKDGKIEDFKYPNNILFKISDSKAEIVTQKVLLTIKKFSSSSNQAIFSVRGYSSLSSYSYMNEDMVAVRLPFAITDYGTQSADGPAKFNGVLKAENYVLAVKDGQVMIYDLSLRGNKITAQGSIQNDALTLKVGAETWVLKFISNSPVGNVFELSAGGKIFACYTLS